MSLIFFCNRFSSADAYVSLNQEAVLCAISCFRILKAVSSSCDFNLLLDCLRSIEMWITVLEKTAILEQDGTQTFQQMEKVVVESFDIVKKWLKKSLSPKISCYTVSDTNKELEVCILIIIMVSILSFGSR